MNKRAIIDKTSNKKRFEHPLHPEFVIMTDSGRSRILRSGGIAASFHLRND